MLPLLGLKEGRAHAERRPTPACRLHLRVRLRPSVILAPEDAGRILDDLAEQYLEAGG